jgi:hypothetical protein
MKQVINAINSCFLEAYPEPELILPTEDPAILAKRVRMITEDLICTRQVSKGLNKAYADLDRKTRGFRNYWWQFWRKK